MDCTHTFHTGAGTGIQRLVRRYADALLEIAREGGPEVIPARVAGGQFIPLPMQDGRVAFRRRDSAREEVSSYGRGAALLHAVGESLNVIAHSDRLHAWLNGGPNQDGLARRFARKPAARDPAALELRRGDTILCLDSSWVYDIRTALDEAGRAGALRIAMICDVLPLVEPQWFTDGTRIYFRGWLEAMLPRVEGVVAISRTTCQALHDLADTGRIDATPPPCRAIHLGAELEPTAGEPIRAELKALLERPIPAFLTVGTLEPRKNLEYAIDLFDALAERGIECQWHVVGAAGWLAEATVKRMTRHPRYGHQLHWWSNLNDSELDYCYAKARALVAVSKAEGFGLPLVEARLHGLAVFASNIPVFREVLGDEGHLLPLANARLAAASLEDFLFGRLANPRWAAPSRIARPWRESARELLRAVAEVAAGRQSADALPVPNR